MTHTVPDPVTHSAEREVLRTTDTSTHPPQSQPPVNRKCDLLPSDLDHDDHSFSGPDDGPSGCGRGTNNPFGWNLTGSVLYRGGATSRSSRVLEVHLSSS